MTARFRASLTAVACCWLVLSGAGVAGAAASQLTSDAEVTSGFAGGQLNEDSTVGDETSTLDGKLTLDGNMSVDGSTTPDGATIRSNTSDGMTLPAGTDTTGGPNTTIGSNTTIDSNTTIGSNTTGETNVTLNTTIETGGNETSVSWDVTVEGPSGTNVSGNSSTSVDEGTNGSIGESSVDASVTANGTGVSVDGDANTGETVIDIDTAVNGSITLAGSGELVAISLPSVIVSGTRSDDGGGSVDADGGQDTGMPVSSKEGAPDAGAAGGDSTSAGSGSDSDGGFGPLPVGATGAAALGLVTVIGGAAIFGRGVTVFTTGPSPAGIGATIRTGTSWLRTQIPRILAIAGYSRYDDSDPMKHYVRVALNDVIQTTPGVHLSELEREVDVSLSSVRHHLRVLEDETIVECHDIRGKRRYFPLGRIDPELVAALDDSATASVLRTVGTMEPATVSDLADHLGRDPSTISHHLSQFEEEGLVERERNGQAVETRLSDRTRDVLTVGGESGLPATAD